MCIFKAKKNSDKTCEKTRWRSVSDYMDPGGWSDGHVPREHVKANEQEDTIERRQDLFSDVIRGI